MKKKTWKSFAGVGGFLLVGGVSVSYIANANDVNILDFETLRNAVMKKAASKTTSTPIVNASSAPARGTTFPLEDLTAIHAPSVEHSQMNNLTNVAYNSDIPPKSVAEQSSSTYSGITNNSAGGYSSAQAVSQNQQNKPSQSSSPATSRPGLPNVASAPAQPTPKSNNNNPDKGPDSTNKNPSADKKPIEVVTPKPDTLVNADPVITSDNQKCIEEKSSQDPNKSNSILCTTKDKQDDKEIVNGDNKTNTSPNLGSGNSPQSEPINAPQIILTENQQSGSLDSGIKTDDEKNADLDSLIECDTNLSKCGLVSSSLEDPSTGLLPVNFENNLSATGIPLPGSLWLAGLGMTGLLIRRQSNNRISR